MSSDFELRSRRLVESGGFNFEEVENHWVESANYQLTRARNVEALRQLEVSAQGENISGDIDNFQNGKFPFVVCSDTPGFDGFQRAEEVNFIFGDGNSKVIYNDDLKTCFFVYALASNIESVYLLFEITPMNSVMKFRKGLIDFILTVETEIASEDNNSIMSIVRYRADLCMGAARSPGEVNLITNKIANLIEATNSAHYFLTSEAPFFSELKLDSNKNKYDDGHIRRLFLSDVIGIDNDDRDCGILYRNLSVTSNKLGTAINIILKESYFQEGSASITSKCLLALVVGIASQPEVCAMSQIPDGHTSNYATNWIVQSDIPERTPFKDIGLDGTGQVIALSDTGLDVDNCYFWDSLRVLTKNGTTDYSQRKVIQYVSNNADDRDGYNGHGTHVAATLLGARAKNGVLEDEGPANGIASGAKISFFDMGITCQESKADSDKICNGAGLGNQFTELIFIEQYKFLTYFYFRIPVDTSEILDPGFFLAKANIHSVSWYANYNGDVSNQYEYREKDFDEFMYDNDLFLIVTAAGNNGRTCRKISCTEDADYTYDNMKSLTSPASNKNGLTVGSTQGYGPDLDTGMAGRDYLAYFSSRGPTVDGRIKPDILAPGYWVFSAAARPKEVGECDGNTEDFWMKGTSMSAPVVSGTAAIVRQYFEQGFYPSRVKNSASTLEPSGSLVKAVLLNGAQFIKEIQNDPIKSFSPLREYDSNQGFGRVSLQNSLPLSSSKFNLKVFDKSLIYPQKLHAYEVSISKKDTCSSGKLSVTVTWADPAAPAGCNTRCLINNINLSMRISKKSGTSLKYPNGLKVPDTINNAERIQTDVSDGDYAIIYVHAKNLATQSQRYALVITGCWDKVKRRIKLRMNRRKTRQRLNNEEERNGKT
eukprot:CAMPEP_0194313632 /NCGR_PEP_ID=MMETSP0171-20130528/10485_1 /TAXON_ID=218684 /ORGANISM="Corethron pennatum, Strain L29A3" /LENGTH=880 /DNA_ID=CAMNT_0039068663 /DNA_START=260 /DNA_END=2901 /DNA_ORIENTATION=-